MYSYTVGGTISSWEIEWQRKRTENIGLLSGLFAGAVLLLVVFLIHGILAFIAGAVAGVLRP
jgi:hypothetical protein